MNFSKLGGTSAIEVNFMAFGLHKFSESVSKGGLLLF